MIDKGSPAFSAYSPNQLDEWLRARLGRRVVVGLLVPFGVTNPNAESLVNALADYAELRLLRPSGNSAATMLKEMMVFDPDALVVWAAADVVTDASAVVAGETGSWPVAVIAALDAHESRDRCVLLLAGPAATRVNARRLGFEDGFTLATPVPELAAALARAAVSIEEQRRRGSSPPCYLE